MEICDVLLQALDDHVPGCETCGAAHAPVPDGLPFPDGLRFPCPTGAALIANHHANCARCSNSVEREIRLMAALLRAPDEPAQ